MDSKIVEYVLNLGLTYRDVDYYINNGYSIDETIHELEVVNSNLMDFDFDEF